MGMAADGVVGRLGVYPLVSLYLRVSAEDAGWMDGDLTDWFRWAMGIFWGVVAAIGVGYKVAFYLQTSGGSTRPTAATRGTSWWSWIKSRVLTPATFGRRCAESYGPWGTVPPRVQSITIGLFVALNIFTSIHGYRVFPGNM
jgi:hypothetical protein